MPCCRCSSMAEQLFCKQQVVGSSPTIGSAGGTGDPLRDALHRERVDIPGSYRSGQTGLTVNQLAYAFGGSNPPLPTRPACRWSYPCPSSSGVEHNLGKVGVTGSIPVSGSSGPSASRCVP